MTIEIFFLISFKLKILRNLNNNEKIYTKT